MILRQSTNMRRLQEVQCRGALRGRQPHGPRAPLRADPQSGGMGPQRRVPARPASESRPPAGRRRARPRTGLRGGQRTKGKSAFEGEAGVRRGSRRSKGSRRSIRSATRETGLPRHPVRGALVRRKIFLVYVNSVAFCMFLVLKKLVALFENLVLYWPGFSGTPQGALPPLHAGIS